MTDSSHPYKNISKWSGVLSKNELLYTKIVRGIKAEEEKIRDLEVASSIKHRDIFYI